MQNVALFRVSLLTCALFLPTGCTTQDIESVLDAVAQSSSQQQVNMAEGIKQALELGSERASADLSQRGGYANNPLLRIQMPEHMQQISGTLRRYGLGGQVDRIESLMNQGAEQAAIEAKAVFFDAIRAMTIDDAVGIVRGPDNAATLYFKDRTEAALRARYQPIIERNLQQVGFYNQYRTFLGVYENLPIPNKVSLDLEQHVLDRSLQGLFTRMADEEALIRKDPLGRGSTVIASMFNRAR